MSQNPTSLYSLPLAPESTKHFHTDPLPLNTGAPPFEVDQKVREEIMRAVEASKDSLPYPPTRGITQLRQKIAHDYGYSEEGVIITYGASQALYNILSSTVGDEDVLIPAPFWYGFPNVVSQGRGRLKIIQTSAENDFKLTPQQLAQSITWKSRILILTNPNNPTGAIYTHAELDALVEVLLKHPRLLVVSDEVYNRVLLDEKSCPSISSWPKIKDRVLTVNSLSKNYAMSGLRVGFIAAHPSWADVYLQKQNYTTLGVNEFLQRGALAALEKPKIVSTIVNQLKDRRAKAIQLLDTVKNTSYITPQSAYFFFWNIQQYIGCRTEHGKVIQSDVDLADYILQDANVAVVAGSLCGTPGYFRVTYAIKEKPFEKGITNIRDSLEKLRGSGS